MNRPIDEQITTGEAGREVQTDEAVKIFLPRRVEQGRPESTGERPWVPGDCGTGLVSDRVSYRHNFQSMIVGIADWANDLDIHRAQGSEGAASEIRSSEGWPIAVASLR
jgi:hypothetical protein